MPLRNRRTLIITAAGLTAVAALLIVVGVRHIRAPADGAAARSQVSGVAGTPGAAASATIPASAAAKKPAPTSSPSPKATNGFAHPGVLVSRAQLDFVRSKVKSGAQPWKRAYDQMMAHRYASLTRAPKPRAVIECGPYSNPNLGCSDETDDALAAYTLALAWYITGDSRYATRAITIMDAWSAVITRHSNSNAPLQAAWAGSVWPRAAEIIRYTYTGWPAANVKRFGTMLRTAYLPMVINGNIGSNGNWDLSMIEATVGIAVFLEDRSAYNKALTRFRSRLPAYVYLSRDGSFPKGPAGSGMDTRAEIVAHWHGQGQFVDGLSQETCRDFAHTGYGISSIAHVAETTRHQGRDVYPEIKDRLRQALTFHARFELGEAAPSWLCGGQVSPGMGPITEVAYNALHNRMGIALPGPRSLTEQQRPAGTNTLFLGWETLTHAANPA